MKMIAAFASQAAFDTWLAEVDKALGYPNPATGTLTYTTAKLDDKGKVYAVIDENCPKALLPATLHDKFALTLDENAGKLKFTAKPIDKAVAEASLKP